MPNSKPSRNAKYPSDTQLSQASSPKIAHSISRRPIIQLRATVPYTAFMLSAVGISNTITMNVQHEERWIGE
jgi:hypothetical protein